MNFPHPTDFLWAVGRTPRVREVEMVCHFESQKGVINDEKKFYYRF